MADFHSQSPAGYTSLDPGTTTAVALAPRSMSSMSMSAPVGGVNGEASSAAAAASALHMTASSAYAYPPPPSGEVKYEAAAPGLPLLPPLQQQQQQQHHHLSLQPPPPPPSHLQSPRDGHLSPPPEHHDGSAASTNQEKDKIIRLRKACDSCSVRKVKCDESGPPCRACAALDIPCTFERPSKRRGPPNRHAEAIKKRRLELDEDPSSPHAHAHAHAPYTSPSHVAATLASFSTHAVFNAESICPMPLLELLVDDFFTYIHPLCPFPHEPSFRGAFRGREDLQNPSFLALLASMVGILVASFPRRPRLHLKLQNREDLFPSSMSLVDRCHKVAIESRGAGYLDKEITIYDAATSYFLGLTGAYTFNWKQCRLYFGETLTLVRLLGAHKSKQDPALAMGTLPQYYGARETQPYPMPEQVDYIKQEIGKRIFWVMFVGVRSMQQLGASFGELVIPPPTPTQPYPPLPLEVDDEYIFATHIDPQPSALVSRITGFNSNIKIFKSITPLMTMEMAYGIDEVFDLTRQRNVLAECLRAVRHVMDDNPAELVLQPGREPGQFAPPTDRKLAPEADLARPQNGHDWPAHFSPERRKIQYEIQKANIYASQLGTRSYLVEKWWNLQDAHSQRKAHTNLSPTISSPGFMASGLDNMLPRGPTSGYDSMEADFAAERENIVKDLLKVLNGISQVNMEPNGGSFIHKVREIASTLVGTPENRQGPIAQRAQEYLARFLEMLLKLERFSPSRGGSDAEALEEEQLRHWADLRAYQTRFAQAGGFLSQL